MIRIPSFDQLIFSLFIIYAAHVLVSHIDGQLVVETGSQLDGYGQFISGATGRVIFGSYLIIRIRTLALNAAEVDLYICALGIFSFLSFVWSIDPLLTIYRSSELLFLITLPIVFVKVLGWKTFQRTLWWTLSSVLVVSCLLASSGSPYGLMGGNHQGLWRGLFQHKNTFGSFAVLVWIITLFGVDRNIVTNVPRLIVLGAALVSLVMSGSATGVVLLILATGWGAVHRALSAVSLSVGVFRLSLLLALATVIGMSGLLYPAILELVGRDESFTGRTALWAASWSFVMQHPWGMGYGLGGGQEVLDRMRYLSGWSVAPSTHNAYITMALDVGWAATLGYVLWLAHKIFWSRNASATLVSVLAVYYGLSGIPDSTSAAYLHLPIFLLVSSSLRSSCAARVS